jgi:hypothetical protein
MILFQWLALPLLALAFLADFARIFRVPGWRRFYALRAALWAAAAIAIADPALTSRVANQIGIGRGADLVLYLFVLAFVVVSLLFYAALQRQQRQITELVRVLAIQRAERPEG